MSDFRMTLQRHGFMFEFNGTFAETYEPDITAMVAAMTEGLESNGYTVDASITLNTRIQLVPLRDAIDTGARTDPVGR